MRPDRAAAQSAAKKQTQGSRRDDWLPPLEIGGAFIVYEFALSLVCPAPENSFAPRPRRGAAAGTGGRWLAASRTNITLLPHLTSSPLGEVAFTVRKSWRLSVVGASAGDGGPTPPAVHVSCLAPLLVKRDSAGERCSAAEASA